MPGSVALVWWRSGTGSAVFPGRWQALEEDHGGSAAGTLGCVQRGFAFGCVAALTWCAKVHWLAAQEHDFHPRLAGGGMVESAIPNTVQSPWQDVAQVAADSRAAAVAASQTARNEQPWSAAEG